MVAQNREYKDRLFVFLFGSKGNEKWTLDLYNAVNGSSHTDSSAVKFTTIHEIMYLSMRNDISFLISDEISLYEQQSTYNPNMPLRMLQYLGNLYEKEIASHDGWNKYGRELLRLPAPRFVVFYNGKDNRPDEEILRLSDAFPKGSSADVEVRVRVLNINRGRNKDLLRACKPLAEYSWLVTEVRENNKNMGDDELALAIDRAISKMPDDFLIKQFLLEHRAEVRGMLLAEYNEAETMELFRKEGREEGREEGRKEGREEGALQALASLVRDGVLSVEVAAKRAKLTEEAFIEAMQSM